MTPHVTVDVPTGDEGDTMAVETDGLGRVKINGESVDSAEMIDAIQRATFYPETEDWGQG